MKRFLSILLLIAAAHGAFLAAPTSVSALECAGIIPLDEEFARSDAVFRGAVEERFADGRFALRVDAVWKGDVGPSTIVQPNMWVDFSQDDEYIVFAERRPSDWVPILCGNGGTTSAFARHALGEPIASFPRPVEDSTAFRFTGKTAAFAAAVLVVGAFVSFAAGARWARRRRSATPGGDAT
ncbi:MAG TPA: hypothetical protein VEZ72_17905 [Paenibacillus sp.]|nr:hypothetical protein [Paenibacillus sp.]